MIEHQLITVASPDDVLADYRGTPIEQLLLAQNLGRDYPSPPKPHMVVVTCVDPRIGLKLPIGAAFTSRSAGVRLPDVAMFQVAFPMSAMGIRHVAVIAHEDCAMVGVKTRREQFIAGFTASGGVDAATASDLFDELAPQYSIEDPIAVVIGHAARIRERCGAITVAPLYYSVSDHRLSQIVT